MSTAKLNAPVVIGVGQAIQRDMDLAAALGPLELASQSWGRAAEDAGLTRAQAATADAVALVDVLGWQPTNGPRLLAETMGARPSREVVTTIGGSSPQALVNHFAREIEEGRTKMAVIAGANAFATHEAARRAQVSLDWPMGGAGQPELFGDRRPGSSPLESAYEIFMPAVIYPLFENAFRHRRGLSIAEHSRAMGALLERMSTVAASNPYAWFREERTAEEICEVTATNRMVGFPYTKYMNSILNVDQSAALILTSEGVADELGVAREQRVYVLAGADAVEDPYFLSERENLLACPGLVAPAEAALGRAGFAVSDFDAFDLYSCFPIAVELACEKLGLAEDDPRGVTVTGGLPSFGGPGSNYTTHAIASMVERLRAGGGNGLVTATGWYLTKHSMGVYSSEPGANPSTPVSFSSRGGTQTGVRIEPVLEANGPAVVETYTVLCARDGEPESGVVLGRLADDSRFLARAPADPATLKAMMQEEAVGRPCVVRSGDRGNTVSFD